MIKVACPSVRRIKETVEASLEIRVEEAMVVLKETTQAATCSEEEDHRWAASIKVGRPSEDIVMVITWADSITIATFRTK